MPLDELRTLYEHAAGASRRVQNQSVKRFNHLDNQPYN